MNLDKLTYAGNLENLKDVEKRDNYTFVKANICDKEAISKMKDGVVDLTKFVLIVGKNKDKRDRVIKIEFKAFRGVNPEDGSDNTFTMFTFYVKQPFQ